MHRRFLSTSAEVQPQILVIHLLKGQERVWVAHVNGARADVSFGTINGKQQVMRMLCESGKQGRSAAQQQLLEVRRRALDKIAKSGYVLDRGRSNFDPQDGRMIILESSRGAENESANEAGIPLTPGNISPSGNEILQKIATQNSIAEAVVSPVAAPVLPTLPALNLTKKSPAVVKTEDSVSGAEATTTTTTPAVEDVPLPMLAKNLDKIKLQPLALLHTLFVQEKLDGIRCLINLQTGRFFSRTRHEIPAELFPHFGSVLSELSRASISKEKKIIWVDGEIYRHGMGFQKITSIVRKRVTMHPEVSKMEFHAFDAVLPETFSVRYEALSNLLQPLGMDSPFKLVPAKIAKPEDVENFHNEAVLKGYEGIMVRLDKPGTKDNKFFYRCGKRSSALLKFKIFQQEEFQCIRINPQERRLQENQESFVEETMIVGSVTVALSDGREFQATPAMSDEEKREMWVNRDTYKNWLATVKFQGVSDTGIPRFPVIVGFRHEQDRG